MATFNFLRGQPPPTYLSSPSLKGVPAIFFLILFFIKKTAKDYTLDYLDYVDGLGHFLSGFGATAKKSRGGGNSLWEDGG